MVDCKYMVDYGPIEQMKGGSFWKFLILLNTNLIIVTCADQSPIADLFTIIGLRRHGSRMGPSVNNKSKWGHVRN